MNLPYCFSLTRGTLQYQLREYHARLRREARLSNREAASVMEVTRRIADNLAADCKEVRKVVDEAMGGEVWELDVDKAINKAVAERDRKATTAMIAALRSMGADDQKTMSSLQTFLGLSEADAKEALSAYQG